MDATMKALQKKMPSKRQLTSTINHLVQQKSVAVLYTPAEVERIKHMTEMIAQATSEFEEDEDWDRILRVVDALSNVSNRAVLKESIRYLRLRLGDPSSRVIILALTLTESIVKNCGDLVHQEIASEPFMSEMEALYRTHANKRGRASMEIASRVLEMVQAWGEAFLPYRHVFPLFVDTYHNMRKKGVKFPDQYDESKVPVLTPSLKVSSGDGRSASERRPVSSNNSHGPNSIDTSSYSNTSSGLGGLSTPELYRVATNVLDMFEDMLYEAQKNISCIGNRGVMQELVVEVREIVHRMEGAIPIAVVEEDENLGKYLSVNDNLHAALQKYDELVAKKRHQEETFKECTRGSSEEINLIDPFGDEDDMSPPNNQAGSDFQEDPFADFVRARTSSKTDAVDENKLSSRTYATPEVGTYATPEVGIQVAPEVPEQAQDDDPFASFVKERATKILSSSNQDLEKETRPVSLVQQTATAAPEKNLIDLWNASNHVQPASSPDLWQKSANFSNASEPHASVPTAPTEKMPAYHPSETLAASQRDEFCKRSRTFSTSSSDPFEMLDFSKAAVSTPVVANPFDNFQHSIPTQPATKSFNPFDF